MAASKIFRKKPPGIDNGCACCRDGWPRWIGDGEDKFFHELPEPAGTFLCEESPMSEPKRKYLITVQSMNFCDEHQAAGVVTGEFTVARDDIDADKIRNLIDALDSTITQATVKFRPMTDAEIDSFRSEMRARHELADKIAADTATSRLDAEDDEPANAGC